MASFQNRGTKKKPSWQYTISRMVNGKPAPIRKGGFKTKAEAEAAAAEIEQQLRKGITPHLKPEPFADYFDEWLKLYKTDVAGNTLERYKNTAETIRQHFGSAPIQSITKRSYQAFLNGYARSHTRESTRKLNTHIRACVRDAIDEGVLHVDFTRNAVLSGEKESKRPEDKALDYFEAKRLMRALEEPTELSHYLILLGLASGARFAEMVGLTRPDFDFEANTIRIDKTWGYTKKMHDGFGPTKNGKSRIIKMNPKIMDKFRRLFETTPDNIYRLVFYSPSSKYKVLSNGAANKTLEAVLRRLNIEPISIHGLRHTHASILLYKRVSVLYVADRLGDDVDTINTYYAHIIKELRAEDEKNTVKIIDEMAI